ncbi:MAG: histidinol-phosphatase [Phycisphaerae bacterium]|jgi:histidinol phosphatase-like enzyme (inositol monophosphatase family)
MDAQQLRDALDFAVEAAQLAGTLTLGYFRTGTPHELKADNSPVTIADRGSEELLRKRIESTFPDHGILGEEFGEKPARSPARWILDPIDGTFSFISGVPLYSVLVGLEWAGEMVVGVIHLPALGETVYAAKGLGCWCNGRRAHVSSTTDMSQARLSVTGVKIFEQQRRLWAWERLRKACQTDRCWADAYGYACLATGRVDVVADSIMNIWDNAALLPVVTEAGGKFTDWTGERTHKSPDALATNGHLHAQALALVREPPRD